MNSERSLVEGCNKLLQITLGFKDFIDKSLENKQHLSTCHIELRKGCSNHPVRINSEQERSHNKYVIA